MFVSEVSSFRLTLPKAVQPLKMSVPRFASVMPVGKLADAKDVQPENALFSILVTVLGITILDRAVFEAKALDPIIVTQAGMVTELKAAIRNTSVSSFVSCVTWLMSREAKL